MEIETEVHKETYTDGDFPFYAMGCTPPVINGAIHFVPTGDWSQFFVMPGGDNELDEGDYVVYLDLTSDKDASGVDLTMQMVGVAQLKLLQPKCLSLQVVIR